MVTRPPCDGPPLRDSAAMLGPTIAQLVAVSGLVMAFTIAVIRMPDVALDLTILAFQAGFLVCAAWRIVLVLVGRYPLPAPPEPSEWPRYSLLIALHDEAEVASQLIERLAGIDYPADRLEALFLLEAHDLETIDVVVGADRPDWMQVLIVPPGSPGTKPRALNHGLTRATGDLLTIYDAEDDPDPLQLREAAARFAADTTGRLACLQAPLRIRRLHRTRDADPFLDRQFAVEYAALFEITLPAMARLGLPFPLGGTSNHFRADALRGVGGWDAFNVTEDADLGFRLWRHGWRLGVLERPTHETPPGGLESWLPQRTRWLKGYMQTWGVHTRDLRALGLRGGLSLTMTLGAAMAAAAVHAASLAWVTASVLIAAAAGLSPETPMFSVSVLVLGTAAAWLHCAIGARPHHVPYSAADMVGAPAYWSLSSLAFVHALWRLAVAPHTWDKTAHYRDVGDVAPTDVVAVDAGRQAA